MAPPVDDLENCRFLPLKILEKVINQVQAKSTRTTNRALCRISLLTLQHNKKGHCPTAVNFYSWSKVYAFALRKAAYAHDWDQLLHLLRAAPVWEHNRKRPGFADYYYGYFDNYFKAFTILLMNHPVAKSKNLLHEYLHMVQSCRSDEDKRALVKLLSTLPDKLISRNSFTNKAASLMALYERRGESF